MKKTNTNTDTDRRRSVRLAGTTRPVEAVVVDLHDQPVELLARVQLLNVSAGGLAMLSDQPIRAGSHIKIMINGESSARDEESFVNVEAIDCHDWPSQPGRYKTRCRRLTGAIPAELIYGW